MDRSLLNSAALLIVTCLVAYAAARLVKQRRLYRNLPKPPHNFLFGHLLLIGRIIASFPSNIDYQTVITTIAQTHKLPGLFYLDLWPFAESQLIITDPRLAQEIATTKSFPKHKAVDAFLRPLTGKGNIASTNGPEWKHLHTMLAPAFKPGHIKSMVAVTADEAITFRKRLHQLAESGEQFSLEDLTSRLIFDVMAKLIFNFPLHAQQNGSACLTDLRDTLSYAVAERNTWNPVTKLYAGWKRRAALNRTTQYIVQTIMERNNTLHEEGSVLTKKSAVSILDLVLLELQSQQGTARKSDTVSPPPLLDPEFMEVVVTNIRGLLVGGQGTTADTLCFINMLLSVHPEVLEKLRSEHSHVFHPSATETFNMLQTSPHILNKLEYTTAVIKEALRLFPVGTGVRAAPHGSPIDYKGKQFPTQNHMLMIGSHTMHYDPLLFDSPMEFAPERHLSSTSSATSSDIDHKAFRPFERGPRACIGQGLAIDEIRVILLLTVREFDFECCAALRPNRKQRAPYTTLDLRLGDQVFQEIGLSSKPRDGMMVTVRRSHPPHT